MANYEIDYDSDYSYHSDGSSYYSDDESIEEIESEISNIPVLNSKIEYTVPFKTTQYQWVVFCVRVADAYPECCTYDKPSLSISFGDAEKSFRLYVEDTLNEAKQYPLVPPFVEWTGTSKIILSDYVKIMFNCMLSAAKWNICTDVNEFIFHSTQTLKFSACEECPLSNALCNIIRICRMTFSFDVDHLPEFGIVENTKTTNRAYMMPGEKIEKNNSLAVLINDDIQFLAQNIHYLNDYHKTVLRSVLARVVESKLSKLEIVMNEDFYSCIVQLTDIYPDFDITEIKDIIESDTDNSNSEDEENDKILFVDSFVSHTYAGNNSVVKPKFVKRIMSEIETIKDTVQDFQTYVIISEQNIQQMKIMMVPDYDTPYGGGYFEFDLYIGGDYPQSPPKVTFLTTGCGRVRFNPNLYNCGKVCLSLLNTWASPQWNSSCSTISQVLLSIHSMIFVEHPYTNEPGFYNALSTPQGRERSEQYNKDVRTNTALVAIQDQITNQQTPFKHIIQKHWEQHSVRAIAEYAKHDITIFN